MSVDGCHLLSTEVVCYFQVMEFTHSGFTFIVHWIVSGVAVLLTSRLVRGFEVSGFFAALLAALVIGLANALLWPLLFFLTLPLNILTLGFFTFVLNGIVLKICAAILPGFQLLSWFSAIFGAIVLALFNILLHWLLV